MRVYRVLKLRDNYNINDYLLHLEIRIKLIMSTIADRKMKETSAGAVMILCPKKGSATDRNNCVEWMVATHDDLGHLYGAMASVLTTQVAYETPSDVLVDYTPEPKRDSPPFSTANIMRMRVAAPPQRKEGGVWRHLQYILILKD